MARSLLDLVDSLTATANSLSGHGDVKSNPILDKVNAKVKSVVLVIVKNLTLKTPVDTSRALSNWVVSLEAPTNYSIPAYYKGSYGSTQSASAASAVSNAESVLRTRKFGQVVYITNNLRYIKPLNDGTISKQGDHFVEASILLGRLEARRK